LRRFQAGERQKSGKNENTQRKKEFKKFRFHIGILLKTAVFVNGKTLLTDGKKLFFAFLPTKNFVLRQAAAQKHKKLY
jgi:hypothetical protein